MGAVETKFSFSGAGAKPGRSGFMPLRVACFEAEVEDLKNGSYCRYMILFQSTCPATRVISFIHEFQKRKKVTNVFDCVIRTQKITIFRAVVRKIQM